IDDTQAKIKEIKDANQKIKDNIDKIAEDAAKAGAPKDIVDKIATSGSVMDAIGMSGGYLQSSSNPDIAKYLQYKRDMEAKGLVPLDYNSFQDNQDKKAANLKSKEAYNTAYNTAAGKAVAEAKFGSEEGGNYSPKQLTSLTRINDSISKNATYAKTTSMRNFKDNVMVSLGQKTGLGDISAINQFQKVIDEGAVTRDQDVKLIQQSQSLANELKLKIKKLEKGDQLSESQRKEMETLVGDMYKKQIEALKKDAYISAKTTEAKLNKLNIEDTIIGELDSFDTNPQEQVNNFVSSPEARVAISPEMNTKISSITGQTFNTSGELAIYMSGLAGATPESVSATLKSLGFIK
ncbi:MAG: hypothetical protein ACOYLO_16235, partial [Ferruginibacter sp.]